MEDYERFLDAVDRTKGRFGVESIKHEQLEALFNLVSKKDVFVNLPTGFGKSLIYQMAPLVVKHMGLCSNPIILVISPLVALMQEQVSYLNSIGISATCLSQEKSDPKLQSGDYAFVYSSPESLLGDGVRRELFTSPVYKERIYGVVVDEAHCISHWGYGSGGQVNRRAFRRWYSCVQEIRSILSNNIPMMALTATAVKKTKDIIIKSLAMKNPVTIAASPNKANISYSVELMSNTLPVLHHFKWLTDELKEKGTGADRVIIYCQTVKQCHTLYSILLEELGESVHPDDGNKKDRLLEMLHSITPDRVKEGIIRSMAIHNGTVRCLLCTIAFGMGINCKGVTTVIHFGPSKNVEAYIQESGRCGRGGEEGKAVILFMGRMLRNVDNEMKEYVHLPDDACRRKFLLKFFDISANEMLMAQTFAKKHECCDLCAKTCSCSTGTVGSQVRCAAVNDLPVPKNAQVPVPPRHRIVTLQQQECLRNKLLVLRKELMAPIFEKFTGKNGEVITPTLPTIFHTFSSFQINQILLQANCLFNLKDINSHIEIWEKEHAFKILLLLNDIFDDMDPLPEITHNNGEDEEGEDEWDEIMDVSFNSAYTIDADISSFDLSNMEYIDDGFPTIAEEALQHI